MSLPPLPQLALTDVEAIVDHYLSEAGVEVAARFLDALETAIAQIRDQPGIGSPRLAQALNARALRVWPVKGFPQVIFYLDRAGSVEIWRILHSARDIPSNLRE